MTWDTERRRTWSIEHDDGTGDVLLRISIADRSTGDNRQRINTAIEQARRHVRGIDAARAVCTRFDVTIDELREARPGTARQIEARQEVVYAMREAGWSWSDIGRHLHRDHSSALNAHKRAAERRDDGADTQHGGIDREDCEVCGDPSLGGGRWCWPCYRAQASPETPPKGPSRGRDTGAVRQVSTHALSRAS